MIPGIGTIINSLAVIGVGIVTRIFVKKEIKNLQYIFIYIKNRLSKLS